MLDFTDLCACILWVTGCNMRCGYCHNPQIVLGKGWIGEDAAIRFLEQRRGLLDGVVFSGGEATTWSGLAHFAMRVKSMGFAIKLDTNGLRPAVVRRLIEEHLVDRIALDYKAPPARFRQVTGTSAYARFEATLELLCAQRRVPFEVRTTVHDVLLGEQDIEAIANDLARRGYRGTYAIQPAVTGSDRPSLGNLPPSGPMPDHEQLQRHSPLEIVFRRQ